MLRRLITVPIALSILVLAPDMASADAPAKENNCAGAFASGLTPELTSGGGFGESRSAAAREGTVGESERALTEEYASCGTP